MRITQPLNGHVLIRPRKSAPAPAGIDIPESVDKEVTTMGEVVVGNDIHERAAHPDVRITDLYRLGAGQIVLFSSLSPRKVEHDGEECLLIHGEDVLAVIEG